MKRYAKICVLLLMILTVVVFPFTVFAAQNAEEAPSSYKYDETPAESVTVTVTISNDGIPVLGSDDKQTPISHLEVEVPYFDLAEYGLEDYYRYGTDGGSGVYVDNNLVERPTVLHMLIYLTERYYLGLPEEECGVSNKVSKVMDYREEKEVLYFDGEVAYTSTLAAFSPSGSATSLYMNGGFWGHDENLMYYRNHRYPLMSEGWGATADYILLSDGDDFDLAMFTNWEFYHSGKFLTLGKENYVGQPGTTLTVTTYSTRTSAVDVDGSSESPVIICKDDMNVCLYDEGWSVLDTEITDNKDGTYDITLPEELGDYYVMVSDTEAATELAAKAPGTAKISVVDAETELAIIKQEAEEAKTAAKEAQAEAEKAKAEAEEAKEEAEEAKAEAEAAKAEAEAVKAEVQSAKSEKEKAEREAEAAKAEAEAAKAEAEAAKAEAEAAKAEAEAAKAEAAAAKAETEAAKAETEAAKAEAEAAKAEAETARKEVEEAKKEQENTDKKDIFTDVSSGSYYYDGVYWAVDEGITTGLNDTHFGPTDTCTRAQVVTFLWRTAGSPEPKTANNPFVDVKAGQYYYKAVLWAVEEGITTGKTKTEFGPSDVVSRNQAVTFLWRSKGKPEPTTSKNPFADVKADQYYYKAVLWAVENNITTGKTAVLFAPADSCDRSQIVTFLYRARE